MEIEEQVADSNAASAEVGGPTGSERRRAVGRSPLGAVAVLRTRYATVPVASPSPAICLPDDRALEWQEKLRDGRGAGADWREAADLLGALGHPVRLALLQRFLSGAATVAEASAPNERGASAPPARSTTTCASWSRPLAPGAAAAYVVPPQRVIPLLSIVMGTHDDPPTPAGSAPHVARLRRVFLMAFVAVVVYPYGAAAVGSSPGPRGHDVQPRDGGRTVVERSRWRSRRRCMAVRVGMNGPGTKVPSHGIRAYGQKRTPSRTCCTRARGRAHRARLVAAHPAGHGVPHLRRAGPRRRRRHGGRGRRTAPRPPSAATPGRPCCGCWWSRRLAEVGGAGWILGNHVVVDHGDGVHSAYALRGSARVGVGDRVRCGEVVGDDFGNTTEPHLHFQLMDAPVHRRRRSPLPVARRGRAGGNRRHQGDPETAATARWTACPRTGGSSWQGGAPCRCQSG